MATVQRASPPIYSACEYQPSPPKTSIEKLHSALSSKFLHEQPSIEISLAARHPQVPCYSTNEEIRGHVTLNMENVLEIFELSIVLEGTTTTYVQDYTAPTQHESYVHGTHTFLRVAQLFDHHQLRHDNDEAIRATCTFPFMIVVPDRLLPQICSHKTKHAEVKNMHLLLPPSLGDVATSTTQFDDMTPEMAKILYTIKARASVLNASGKVVDLEERTRQVRILPVVDEQPPMIIDAECSAFRLSQEKCLKHGFFKRTTYGRLVAEFVQPQSFRLPLPSQKASDQITTAMNIVLRYYPYTSTDSPPPLRTIKSNIRAYTFFGATPYDDLPFPTAAKWGSLTSLHGLYSKSIELSSHCLSALAWEIHDEVDQTSSEDSARPSSAETNSTYYTAMLNIPTSLPIRTSDKRSRVFVPSFHSCNVSRCYSIELQLSFSNPSGIFATCLKLNTPVQISSEGLIF